MSWFKKLLLSNGASQIHKDAAEDAFESERKYSFNCSDNGSSTTTSHCSSNCSCSNRHRCNSLNVHNSNININNNGNCLPVNKKKLSDLDANCIEIIDPDIFFHDPEHVRNYKEEAKFLLLMSEWEIIENPETTYANFFSAEFEEELLQLKIQTEMSENENENENGNENENENENSPNIPQINRKENDDHTIQERKVNEMLVKNEKCKEFKLKFMELIFTDQIQMGIALPNGLSNLAQSVLRKRRKSRKRKSKANIENLLITSSSEGETFYPNNGKIKKTNESTSSSFTYHPNGIIKDFDINRDQLKTEALACSIMGAIGKCPAKDSSTTLCSSENDFIRNVIVERCRQPSKTVCRKIRCDHYDIKQFFRLDDYGNILLNISHIIEIKGRGFVAQNKRLYRRYRKECQCIDEEMFCQRRDCGFVLKRLLSLLWHIVIGHPRNKISPYGSNTGPGDTVRAYTLQLAQDQCSTFARNIENFISCTKESREAAPQVVMRNMRQFMNGMKNYLVKHGEGKFQQEVDSARTRLKADEFLNLDVILETVMHQLVVLPLREHLYGMFVDYYTRSEDIQLLAQNVKYACGRIAGDFGIRPSVTPPSSTSLTVISNLLLRLQEAELPLDKLELFLCVISTIFDATGCPRGQQLGADDFLPILVYVVAKCGFVGAEIEAEFMWGLLQPTLLNGEPGYYLTALCSAVHVLKSFMASESEHGSGSLDWRSSSLPACSSVLRVIIPDECNGSLQTRTLPVRPHTTTREVCRIIAHKARITNPQDYALFKLVDGEETLLNDIECPQDIRLAAKGKHCMLAYKRIDAKIAWPTTTQPVHN